MFFLFILNYCTSSKIIVNCHFELILTEYNPHTNSYSYVVLIVLYFAQLSHDPVGGIGKYTVFKDKPPAFNS